MEFTARRLNGGTLALPQPLALECTRTYDVPADSLEAVFPAHHLSGWSELVSVSLSVDGSAVFEGNLDEQLLTQGEDGSLLTLRARSAAAILLDNEAIPQVFYRANLLDVYRANIGQYGFRGILYDRNPVLSAYTVAKGRSEWQALEGFCRQALGLAPYLKDGYLVARPRPAGKRFLLSNRGGGLPYRSLTVQNKRYGVISKVILKRRETKLYDTAVKNPLGDYYGLRCKRYVSPPAEWGDPKAGADRLMRDSMQKKLTVKAVLPGLHTIEPGDRVSVDSPAAPGGELAVFESILRAEGSGFSTELLLVLPDYLN